MRQLSRGVVHIAAVVLTGSCGRLPAAPSSPVVQGFVAVRGAQLYYEMFGHGDPIVVVHGGPGMDHTYLLPGMRALARSHLVVFYDQRGSGRSRGEVNASTVSFDLFLADIDALADSLGLARFSLLGHSWGGLLALRYAARHPERLRALVLMNTVEPGRRYNQRTAETFRARQSAADSATVATLMQSQAMKRGDAAAVNVVMRAMFRATFADTTRLDDLALNLDQRTASNLPKVASLLMGSLGASFDYWSEAKTITVPTLVVHGVEDVVPIDMPRELARTIPHAMLIEIEHAGHFPYIERPDETFAAIDEFLRLSARDCPGREKLISDCRKSSAWNGKRMTSSR